MSKKRKLWTLLCAPGIGIFLLSFLTAVSALAIPPAQNEIVCPRLMTVDDVIEMIHSPIPETRKIARVDKCGINFQITSVVEAQLRVARASDSMVSHLRDKAPKPKPPVKPSPPALNPPNSPDLAGLEPVVAWRMRFSTAQLALRPADGLKQLEPLFNDIVVARTKGSLTEDETNIMKDVLKALIEQYANPVQPDKLAALSQKFYQAFPIFPETVVIPDGDVADAIRRSSAVVQFDIKAPGAEVEIDSTDRVQLDGPKDILFSPGQHHITIRLLGYDSHTEDFSVQKGETKSVSPILKPLAVNVFVFIETPGVQAVRDGGSPVEVVPFGQAVAGLRPDQNERLNAELRRQNLNPQTISMAIVPGIPRDTSEIKLRMTKDKYKPEEIQLKLGEFQQDLYAAAGDYIFDRAVQLEKLVGKLEIASDPAGADVFLDGSKIGVTPLNVAHEIGDFELTIKSGKTRRHKERISVKDGEVIKRDLALKPAMVFLGIHSPNEGSTKKPLINPQDYRDTEALIQQKLLESFKNYFVESQSADKYAFTRDFLLRALDAGDAPAEAKRHLRAMRDSFESDLFLFGFFDDERDYRSGTLHLYLFSTFSVKPDVREVRTDRPNEIDDLFHQLDGTKLKPENLLAPYIGLTTLHTKLADRSLVALRVEPGSPASKAGIQEGDSILKIDGQPATSSSIDKWLASHPPGSELQFEINGMDGQRKVSVTSEPIPAVLTTPGANNQVFRNALLIQLDTLSQTLKPQGTSELNTILLNQALVHMEVKAWNDALDSLRTFQDKAANGQVLQPAVYYYRGLCFEQLGDKGRARENFDLAMKETNKRLRSEFVFDFQTLSEWRRNYSR